jgi:hypothetical protein
MRSERMAFTAGQEALADDLVDRLGRGGAAESQDDGQTGERVA